MTKTYTPLIIEGKIYVVVDAPGRAVKSFNEIVAKCTKYETLPEHAPYWKERIGQRVEVVIGQFFKWNDGNYMNTCAVCSERFMHGAKRQPVCKPCCEATYAIPPQQKQGSVKDYHAQILEIIEDNERECTGSNEANIQSASQINQLIRDLLRQQKQGDEWDEAGIKYLNEAGVTVLPPQAYKLFFWFKSRYNLTKK